MSKEHIRKKALLKRNSIPPAVRQVKDSAIEQNLLGLEEFRAADMVLIYASFRSEVDTSAIISNALGMGKRISLPKVEGERLAICEIKGPDELTPGYMGIPEPPPSEEIPITDVDIVILPGVAFDERGYRLGYGKGYYDRLLYGTGKQAVALAYEEQIVGDIPHETHDVRMGIIITDRRIIRRHGQGED